MMRPTTTPSVSTSKSSSFHSPEERLEEARLRTNFTSPNLRSRCASSLDHLVGDGRESGRDFEAERFGGFEVDHEFILGRLLDRDVAGLCPAQNLVDLLGPAPE